MSQSESRRRQRRRDQQQRTKRSSTSLTIPLAVGVAAIALVGVALVLFWPGDDAEAAFEPVPSLEYEYSPNHLHGIGYDHEADRLFFASHFGLFVLENDQLFQVGDTRDDLMGFSMNPDDPTEIFVSGHPMGGGNLGVLRSTDSGLNFEHIFSGVDGETVDFHSMTVSASDSNWFYGSFMGQVYRSEDRGRNWIALQPDGLPQRGLCWGVPCLAADSGEPSTVYAGTEFGLMVSTDAGESWDVVNSDVGQVAAITIDPGNPDRIVAYTQNHGLAISEDRGVSWESHHGDLQTGDGGFVFAIALDQSDPDRMFVATMNNEVYETRDSGQAWTRVI